MPIKDYGVLKGRAVRGNAELENTSPHYQLYLSTGQHEYRIAINVKSQEAPSEVKYFIDENFHHVITDGLEHLATEFTLLPKDAQGNPHPLTVDFIRGNMFNIRAMVPLAYNLPGPDNDLNEKIDFHVKRAITTEGATIYIFGAAFNNSSKKERGVHDVHMNQGNVERFKQDDGTYQDGAIMIHYPTENRWTAIFLAFQSQSIHTDDKTGHRIDHEELPEEDTPVHIIGARVNPDGPDNGNEMVLLLNSSPEAVDLTGWTLANKQKRKFSLKGSIAAGDVLKVYLIGQKEFLDNSGGIITLLDKNNNKIHGVKYTKQQAAKPGKTIVFQ